jgi:hypothetical protein
MKLRFSLDFTGSSGVEVRLSYPILVDRHVRIDRKRGRDNRGHLVYIGGTGHSRGELIRPVGDEIQITVTQFVV